MNFREPSSEYNLKLGLFANLNLCVMLVNKYFECAEMPFNWIYVVLQDWTMWMEFRHQCREVDWSQLTMDGACDLVLNAGWKISFFMFSFVGIHCVLLKQLLISKPEYCKALNEKLGFA